MSKDIKIRRGLDIALKGEAEKVLVNAQLPEVVAVQPTDFHGVFPKLLVKEGDEVKAGSPLFYEKTNKDILFTSPMSGEVIEIARGAKRKILHVKILADKEIRYEDFGAADPKGTSREEVIEKLMKSGLWVALRQRPFAALANPSDQPKSIFISAVDTHPLAPDYDFIVHNHKDEFQLGLDAISKLTAGKVHLNISKNQRQTGVFSSCKGVEINHIDGPHPAGNVGVQIHHIDPIQRGDVVWYIGPQEVLAIGRLFKTGRYDATKIIALTGAEVKNPRYYRTISGARLGSLLADNLTKSDDQLRIISGNVLTGRRASAEGFLGFYDAQVTVIEEGNTPKFFMTDGWLSPGLNKFSLSRAFPSWLMPGKKYAIDSNKNGEERAFVMSGQYEKVFPFAIFPVQLIKAILANDIELMEELGIFEVDAEDFALCEFVCTSKINAQEIVRRGLDTMREEFS